MTMDWSRSDGEKPADAVAWVPPWEAQSSHATTSPAIAGVPGDHRLLRR